MFAEAEEEACVCFVFALHVMLIIMLSTQTEFKDRRVVIERPSKQSTPD